MGQVNEENEEKDNFFDPELEGILKATKEVPVTDNETKIEIGVKPLKDKSLFSQENSNTKKIVERENIKNPSKMESIIKEILSRKDKISIKASINLQVYDKKTLKFLLDLFNKDLNQEEILDIIVKNLDIEELRSSIRSALIAYYHKPIK